MKWTTIVFISLAFLSNGQLQEYNKERLNLDKGLMIGLESWSVANLTGGAIGWATTTKGEAHYFHQMNCLWNTINLGISVPGYIKAKRGESNLSLSETIHSQHKIETIFLINSGLDIMYISGGLLLKSESRFNIERRSQFRGYGNSLLLQGGFLFLFDLTAYILHKRHANQKLNGLFKNIELSNSGLGLRWNIPSNTEKQYTTLNYSK